MKVAKRSAEIKRTIIATAVALSAVAGCASKEAPLESQLSEEWMSDTDFSRLSRPVHPMPDFVSGALDELGLLEAYTSRPAYQQNDYVGWIMRAKRPETKEKRLHQMLDELRRGDVYMKMDYRPSGDSE